MVTANQIDWSGDGPAERCVTLCGGVTVCETALHLVLELESRGIALRIDGGNLLARPAAMLTGDDIARLKQYRDDVRRIVAYEAPRL